MVLKVYGTWMPSGNESEIEKMEMALRQSYPICAPFEKVTVIEPKKTTLYPSNKTFNKLMCYSLTSLNNTCNLLFFNKI
ncbi:hypothetical protein C0Z01_20390 [Photobacterium kishitanii]|nr:hypothetical protein C0Z01_20390 [Photobacterium kishitanii]